MKQPISSIITLVLLGSAPFAACNVNTKDFTFDDDAYEEAKTSDGDGDGDNNGGQGGTTATGDGDLGGGSGDGDGDGEGGDPGTTGDIEPECTMTGELKCDDRQIQVCTGEYFINAGDACEFVCDKGTCTGTCKPGSSECLSETEQRSCNQMGQWSEASECKNVCLGDACGGVCKPGSRSCDDEDTSLKLLCNAEGQWDPDGNCSVGQCEEGACTACTGDETQCTTDSTGVQTCNGSTYDAPEECEDQVCLDGACTGECRPALGGSDPQRRCVAGEPSTQLETCGADGTFGSASGCNFVCVPGSDPGRNDSCGGACKPGEKRCDGTVLMQCASNGLSEEKVEDCSEKSLSCLDIGGGNLGCGECTPGEKEPNNRCAQRMVQTCERGMWVDSDDCTKYLVTLPNVSVCYDGQCTTGNKACDSSRGGAYGCWDAENKWVCNDGADKDGTDLKECITKAACQLTSCITSLTLPPRL